MSITNSSSWSGFLRSIGVSYTHEICQQPVFLSDKARLVHPGIFSNRKTSACADFEAGNRIFCPFDDVTEKAGNSELDRTRIQFNGSLMPSCKSSRTIPC